MDIIKGSRNELEEKASKLIINYIKKSDKKIINLALSGGESVSGIYERLSRIEINWDKINIFLLDERISQYNQETNYALILNSLLNKINIPAKNIHPFINLEEYNSLCPEKFDIIVASSGEDGHIASLFPQHASIFSQEDKYILVNNSPKPPAQRVTASRSLIANSDFSILLFFGREKNDAFRAFENSLIKVEDCPCKLVQIIPKSYVLKEN